MITAAIIMIGIVTLGLIRRAERPSEVRVKA